MQDPEMLKILQRMEGNNETGNKSIPAPGSLSAEKAAMKDILSKINENAPLKTSTQQQTSTTVVQEITDKDKKIAQLEARIERLEQLLLG